MRLLPLLAGLSLCSCASRPPVSGRQESRSIDAPRPPLDPAGKETPWERYLRVPSPANARAVREISYGDPAGREHLFDDLDVLAVQVLSRDAEAADLAFRLMADGHLGEQLDILLGRLVRIDPELFLATLARHRRKGEALGWGAGNFGEEYVDRLEAQRYEAAARIAALKSVADPALAGLRDRCIASLEKEISLLSE
jgi:hypothetical protein